VEIPDDVFARAQRHQRGAVEALFAQVYPPVVRIARALTGRADVAEGVVRFVMTRAMAVSSKWRDATTAERWFLHHTVLTARRAAAHKAVAKKDLLAAGGADPAWAAFVRAVRQLPQQHRVAVLLIYGEHLNDRYLGVAMDCSADAARTHLEAARAELKGLAPGGFEAAVARLAGAYVGLAPAAGDVAPAAGKWAGRALRPYRFRRIVRRLVIVAVLAVAALAVWKWKAG
jgi:DNA-directed RNA polymerase specialized sigma24 family protein